MKKLLLIPVALILATPAFAGPTCTDAARDSWIPADEMKQRIEAEGYSIKKFKETDGNCYEIYGYDSENHKVEIYYDPVDARVVKKEIDD